jgi:hypothetical protein
MYIRHQITQAVMDEVEMVSGTLPGSKAFYSDDGEVLVLSEDSTYIVSVEPGEPKFNNGNPITTSAYLYAEQPQGDSNASIDDEAVIAIPGWSTGWNA